MHYLGIDISKEIFNVYVYGNKGIFKNKQSGFKALFSWLKKKKVLSNLHACIESTGRYGNDLAEFLHSKDIKVSIVNPRLVKDFASSQGKRNKTDQEDAETIARFCEVNKPSLWNPPPQNIKRLIELTRTIEDLKKQKLSLENRLEGQTDKVVQKSLNKLIKALENEIDDLEEEINNLISKDDDLRKKKELLRSIPGIGEQTAGIILAETKGEPEKFDSARALVAYVGLNPEKKQSGTSMNWTRLSRKGSSYFRTKIFFPAMSAVQHNALIKEFYTRLLLKGKSKKQAICACMSKLLKISYGVLKSQKPFDPNYQNLSFSS